MELLQKQLLSPNYIQHSARVLFVVAEANDADRQQMLEAIFDLSREEVVEQVKAGTMKPAALAAHDYVYDIFATIEDNFAGVNSGRRFSRDEMNER